MNFKLHETIEKSSEITDDTALINMYVKYLEMDYTYGIAYLNKNKELFEKRFGDITDFYDNAKTRNMSKFVDEADVLATRIIEKHIPEKGVYNSTYALAFTMLFEHYRRTITLSAAAVDAMTEYVLSTTTRFNFMLAATRYIKMGVGTTKELKELFTLCYEAESDFGKQRLLLYVMTYGYGTCGCDKKEELFRTLFEDAFFSYLPTKGSMEAHTVEDALNDEIASDIKEFTFYQRLKTAFSRVLNVIMHNGSSKETYSRNKNRRVK